jgi:hypothetical protein
MGIIIIILSQSETGWLQARIPSGREGMIGPARGGRLVAQGILQVGLSRVGVQGAQHRDD